MSVQVLNRISEQIIEELHFDLTSESASKGIIGLCSDASAGLFYAYDQNSIFQVSAILHRILFFFCSFSNFSICCSYIISMKLLTNGTC